MSKWRKLTLEGGDIEEAANEIHVLTPEYLHALYAVVEAGKELNDVAAKAVFEDGHEERLLIENWPLMDSLAKFRESVDALRKTRPETDGTQS